MTRAAIIGCGGIAGFHLQAYRDRGVVVAGFVDVDLANAQKLSEGQPDARTYTDRALMLAEVRPDVVSICTPPAAHEEAVRACLQARAAVLCEKPLAHTVAAARAIAEAARQSRRPVMTAFRHRFLPAHQAAQAALARGEIGDLVFFNNVFCGPAFDMKDRWFSRQAIAGGGVLMDTSSHSVDLFRFYAGEVTEARATVSRRLDGTDVEDAAALCLKSGSGAVAGILAAWVAGAGEAYVELMGTKGRIRYDYNRGGELRVTRDGKDAVRPVQASSGFAEEIAHFLAVARGETALACTAQDGLRAVEIIQSCYPQ